MKKTLYMMLTAAVVGISMIAATACHDEETYAEQKEKEKELIQQFIDGNDIVGHINVISEEQFAAQGYTTRLENNEFVLFSEDGIYMQIVEKGGGEKAKSSAQLARERPDSTVVMELLCRFMEYDIKNAETTRLNLYTGSIYDKMLCTYSLFSKEYTASFTKGIMASSSSVVPQGWLKPLDYILFSKSPARVPKVRIILPHTSGISSAIQYVQPYYYEISYQLH